MIFHLYADCTFDADDLEGAFNALKRHFNFLESGGDVGEGEELQLRGGEIHLGEVPPTLSVKVEDIYNPGDYFG